MARIRLLSRIAACVGVVALACSAGPSAQAQSTLTHPSAYVDHLGRPTPEVVKRVNEFAAQPFIPQQVADALHNAIGFFAGDGQQGGPDLPDDAPAISQFLWPTVSLNCLGDGLHSTASAIAVPGPAQLPAPGAPAGHTSFVFTALGTPAAAAEQGDMRVYWVNLTTGRTGVTALGNTGLNPNGPATLSATAETGSGVVVAAAEGSVHTVAAGGTSTCAFAPTVAGFTVR
ncbi:hypothetical protein CAPI_06780 [Corynebacterium capitovis DSM 44611]|uniref:Rv1157c family protein n=1 Tax=Corynebacterium capitovis TaxID=131081 RepID=UPI00037E5461|nr:hypothetical protein [Corynebacterium capitovis]WKD57896.1 hypothetical protein CAPI_06780 [Corynebacterium capitovis DSM 44611]